MQDSYFPTRPPTTEISWEQSRFDLEVRIICSAILAEANPDKSNHHSMLFSGKCTAQIMVAKRAGLENKDIPADGSQNIQPTACVSRAFLDGNKTSQTEHESLAIDCEL